MSKYINLSGQRFGKLLVIGQYGLNKYNKIIWDCLCDCGVIVKRTTKAIKKAKELYCGNMHPTKICTRCKVEKEKTNGFHKGTSPIGVASVCKQCKIESHKIDSEKVKIRYHEIRKDPARKLAMRINSKKSRLKNKHKELNYKREYNKRPHVIEKRKEIHRMRKENDLQYTIKRRLRGRLRDAVKRTIGVGYKYKSSLTLLGCDMEFFKSYIENQFQYGMNWDRFSYMHLDHVRPCNTFDLTQPEQQRVCFHYSNIQVLWEVDNLTKSKKYTPPSIITDSPILH